MWNLKNNTLTLFTKQKETHRQRIQTYTKGRRGGGKLGIWDWQIKITLNKTGNKVLLYSTGKYVQYIVIN